MDPAPLRLRYALTTDPAPLQASAEDTTQPLKAATVTLVATNGTGAAVTLRGLSVRFEVGAEAAELTPAGRDLTPVPPPGWQVAKGSGDGTVTYHFTPGTDGPPSLSSGASRTFTFRSVEVNRAVGTTSVLVTEVTETRASVLLPLTKWPDGWADVAFWSDPDVVEPEQPFDLHWKGPVGATYTIGYYDGETAAPVTLPKDHQPALKNEGRIRALTIEDTTAFTLTVHKEIDGHARTQSLQRTVTVQRLNPDIAAFTGRLESTARGLALVLDWETTNAETVDLVGATGPFPKVGRRWRSWPSADAPLEPDYTLMASRGAHTVSKTLTTEWGHFRTLAFNADPYLLALAPDGGRLYLVAGQDTTPHVYDTSRLAPVSGQHPPQRGDHRLTGMAVTPDGSRVIIVGLNSEGELHAFKTGALPLQQGRLEDSGYSGPLLVPLQGGKAYLHQMGGDSLYGIDLETSQPRLVLSGVGPLLALSPDGNYLYAANTVQQNSAVHKVDVIAGASVSSATLPPYPTAAAVSPDGTRLYVACAGTQGPSSADNQWPNGGFQVLDTATMTPADGSKPIALGGYPVAVRVSADGTRVAVATQAAPYVTVIDTATLAKAPVDVGPVPAGGAPADLVIAPDQTRIYVAWGTTLTVLQAALQPAPA